MKLLETVALTKQAMCLAVSPYIPGEAVVVTETGSVHSWRCGQELVTVCSATEQFNANCASEWYQCVFAGNPQCIALANPKAVHLVDFRVSFIKCIYLCLLLLLLWYVPLTLSPLRGSALTSKIVWR